MPGTEKIISGSGELIVNFLAQCPAPKGSARGTCYYCEFSDVPGARAAGVLRVRLSVPWPVVCFPVPLDPVFTSSAP